MNQGDLFDTSASEEARDEAIQKADDNADEEWKDAAERVVRRLSLCVHEFTTDDVWRELIAWGWEMPRESRAMGGIMRRAEKKGWVKPTMRFENSSRVACHRRPLRVWESCR